MMHALIKACIIIYQFCAILKPLLEACFDRMSPNVAEWACKIATGVTGQYWFNPNGTQFSISAYMGYEWRKGSIRIV